MLVGQKKIVRWVEKMLVSKVQASILLLILFRYYLARRMCEGDTLPHRDSLP